MAYRTPPDSIRRTEQYRKQFGLAPTPLGESALPKIDPVNQQKGLNKVLLIGKLSKDPEITPLEGNIKVAKFALATTETYKEEKGQPH